MPALPVGNIDAQPEPADVPEPGSTSLFALALGTMLMLRKKR